MPSGERSHPQESDSAEAFREALRGRGKYIEHKFGTGRASDLRPDYLEDVIMDIKGLSQSLSVSQRAEIMRIRNIEDQVYAAISLHEEPEHRTHYFRTLRGIADTLKRL